MSMNPKCGVTFLWSMVTYMYIQNSEALLDSLKNAINQRVVALKA